ncbi:Cytochrome c4 [Polaromonas sp. CG9_12]|nr:Cytochrome c4 [Polaromonas sp. CG9_12]
MAMAGAASKAKANGNATCDVRRATCDVRRATCAVCHGAQGAATLPNAPNLAGQPQTYLAEQLKNSRSGRCMHKVMGVIAKSLSDQEIEDLSAWHASLQRQPSPGP